MNPSNTQMQQSEQAAESHRVFEMVRGIATTLGIFLALCWVAFR